MYPPPLRGAPVCEAESGATTGALRTKPRCGPYAADVALARRLAAAQRDAAERPQPRFIRKNSCAARCSVAVGKRPKRRALQPGRAGKARPERRGFGDHSSRH